MRNVGIKYKRLGKLLQEGRERKKISREQAAMVLGFTNYRYLWRCESGLSSFPATKIRRALELYKIPIADAVEAVVADVGEAVGNYLRKK